jgi:fluoride exporter
VSGGATLLLVATGGALGAVARYLLTAAVQRRTTSPFPAGTLAVNVLGCLLLGALLASLDGRAFAQQLTAFLAIGFLGDFTTYSTFSGEAVALAGARRRGAALVYVVGSIVLGLAALATGFLAVGWIIAG